MKSFMYLLLTVHQFHIVPTQILPLEVACVMFIDCWMLALKLDWVQV